MRSSAGAGITVIGASVEGYFNCFHSVWLKFLS